MPAASVPTDLIPSLFCAPGQPLPGRVRREMEAFFGADLSAVRLHRHALPAGLAGCAAAEQVVLDAAAGDLASPRARHLLAHELAHVLQQRLGQVAGSGWVADAVLEAEAEHAAGVLASGRALAGPVLPRLAGALSGRAWSGAVQPRIIIQAGEAEGVYDTTRARTLLDAVAVLINGRYQGRPVTVRDEPVLNYLRSADYYRFDSLDALAQYMVQAKLDVRGQVFYADVPAPAANGPKPQLIYGDEHGKLHFGGAPTKDKAKWAMSKAEACGLMEKAILAHRARIWRETPLAGVAGLWYVAANHPKCGRYKDDTREGALTDTFAIQAQVFILQNEIHYHGYPDEQIRNVGCGMTRNGVNDNDEADVERRGGRANGIGDALRELGRQLA